MITLTSLLLTVGVGSCSSESGDFPDPEPAGEGVLFDEENPDEDLTPKGDFIRAYSVPMWVQEKKLVEPEIIVSLDGLTAHLFDRTSDFSRVYPIGPGAKNSSGKSVTPTGFFSAGPDRSDGWWYISDRFKPHYFGGFPFLRLSILNSKDQNTYGFHGPVTFVCRTNGATNDEDCPQNQRDWFLKHDYVSHGCMRMRAEDIVELYYLVGGSGVQVPVTIQKETEVDRAGVKVEVGDEAIDWDESWGSNDAISYGELGPRPSAWTPCRMPSDWPHRDYACEIIAPREPNGDTCSAGTGDEGDCCSTTGGDEGVCIDTKTTSCTSGVVVSGRCPSGPGAVRCCAF